MGEGNLDSKFHYGKVPYVVVGEFNFFLNNGCN